MKIIHITANDTGIYSLDEHGQLYIWSNECTNPEEPSYYERKYKYGWKLMKNEL